MSKTSVTGLVLSVLLGLGVVTSASTGVAGDAEPKDFRQYLPVANSQSASSTVQTAKSTTAPAGSIPDVSMVPPGFARPGNDR